MRLYAPTPLIESQALSCHTGKRVWLKLDALQPTGSFKIRGIGELCEKLVQQGVRRFVSSSGGNAGIAVAYAGRKLGVPVTVIVPHTTSERAKNILNSEGAEVIVHGASWAEAHELAGSLAGGEAALIHPFDDPRLWTGHATLIDEIAGAGLRPDAVVVAIGGGGLYCGIVEGLRRNSMGDVPVIALETEGAASFHGAIQAGKLIELDAITSVATSLGAKKVAAQAFALQQEHPTKSCIVTDKQAVSACMRFLDDHRVLVEPACGAALAALYENIPALAPYQTILCVVCGGSTVTAEQLRSYWLA